MRNSHVTLVEGFALPFLLSVPQRAGAGAEKAGAWPVLCFLHGLGEGPPTEIHAGLTAHGPLRPGSSALVGEFIVAAPQLPARGDIWSHHAGMVSDMLAHVHSRCGGDRKRTYLTGFSFGANGVFDLALLAPALWAALWAVDPTRVPESDPGLPIWLSAGAAARRSAAGFRERLRLEAPQTGADHRVYLDEGLDHVETATSAYASDRVYNWLLSRHL